MKIVVQLVMVARTDIVTVPIPSADYPKILQCARNCSLGGRSHIREAQQRLENLSVDQIVGQLGTYAATWFVFGNPETYFELRMQKDRNPYEGDGGEDIKGKALDIKTSLMRKSTNPLDYRLPVRPAERHNGWGYVLALVDRVELPITVSLVGWAWDRDLPARPEQDGPFKGAFVVLGPNLTPMPIKPWIDGRLIHTDCVLAGA